MSLVFTIYHIEDLMEYLQTGVKFRVVGRHLNLEMQVSEIEFR